MINKDNIYDAYGNVSTKAGWGEGAKQLNFYATNSIRAQKEARCEDTATPRTRGSASFPTLVFAANLNPFLYNGYYYDTETGFYYCNSRYYDPENGRFVNVDEVVAGTSGTINGYNLYVYCFNDPVNMSDAGGNWPNWNDAKKFADKVFYNAREFVEVVSTREFVQVAGQSVLSNVVADAGICIGVGVETTLADTVHIEAISRMDIIGIQFKDGKLRIGHDGRSALDIGAFGWTFGPQNDTYESLNLDEREADEPTTYVDYGLSDGSAAAFFIGYHCNYSISLLGMGKDLVEYINANGEWQ